MVQQGLLQELQPSQPEHLAPAAPPYDVLMELLQAPVPITDHLQPQEEPSRERVLPLQEAVVHRTDRFIPGPALQHHKAGRLIPAPPVAQHQDPPDRQPIAGRVHQDHLPTADQVHQDRHLTAGPAAAVHILAAAGQADHQVLILGAADRRVVVLPTQVVDPDQAVQPAVRVQVAQEDNKLLPRVMPGH